MDVYLPAEFHTLHDEIVADWRDAAAPDRDAETRALIATQVNDEDIDPSWIAI